MTEAEWLTSDDPRPLFEYLNGRAGDRKLQLLGVACCYICRRGERHERLETDYESVVQFVDGTGTREEMRLRWAPRGAGPQALSWPERPFEWVNEFVLTSAIQPEDREERLAHWPTATEMVALIREVFGNPLRPVRFDPAWRTDTAVLLARQMYESREFSAMPILADALQDAGCDSDDVLDHCRDAGVRHLRGCWVVDLVLGKG